MPVRTEVRRSGKRPERGNETRKAGLSGGLSCGCNFSRSAGNTVNYLIGRWVGPKVFNTHIPVLERFLDRAALQKTHSFYDKHGGKTIVLARFIPVVRTFAPFVAGASSMSVARFQLFNVIGALVWVLLLVLLGYFFGNIPFIRQYLNVIVLVGIGAAIVPVALGAVWKLVRGKQSDNAQKTGGR